MSNWVTCSLSNNALRNPINSCVGNASGGIGDFIVASISNVAPASPAGSLFGHARATVRQHQQLRKRSIIRATADGASGNG